MLPPTNLKRIQALLSRKPPYTNILGFLQIRSNLVSECGQEIGASNSKEAWTKWLVGFVHVEEEVKGEMIVEEVVEVVEVVEAVDVVEVVIVVEVAVEEIANVVERSRKKKKKKKKWKKWT